MISDTLSECVTDLGHYLNSPTLEGIYEGELWHRAIRLRNEAEYIRPSLDDLRDTLSAGSVWV
jgi:hypothetical protein